jgi:exopolysaccharide biosynthesis polyprenyl glycosylphosphotransferase
VHEREETRHRGCENEQESGAARAHGNGSLAESTIVALVATKPLVPATSSDDDARPDPIGLPSDIRRARLLPSASQLRALIRRLASIVALVAIDVGGLAGALYLALVFRELYYGTRPVLWGLPWDAEAKWLPFLSLVAVLVFWRGGLYAQREQRAGAGRVVSSLLLVTVITLAFAVGTGYQHTTFGLYLTAFVLSVLIITGLRGAYELVTRDMWRLAGVRRRAVLLGSGERLEDLRRALGQGRGGIDYEFLGAVTDDAGEGRVLPLLGGIRELPLVLERLHPDELIVSGVDVRDKDLLDLVEHANRAGVKVRVAPTTMDLLTQRVEYVAGQGVPLFELRPPVFAGLDWATKRVFDVVVSAGIVLVATPLWLLTALAVKLGSPGPVFYRDQRVGLGEREFGMFKFRSMYTDAGARQAGLEGANEASGPLFKIKDDPRVTRVGRFLRRYSIDELPQILNVLRGEMSLVGPRPLPLRDYVMLEDWHRKRYLVLPGMTGLWQVSGRIELTFDDLVRLDFYYLENWSIWLDISILAKTLPAVLARRGAY